MVIKYFELKHFDSSFVCLLGCLRFFPSSRFWSIQCAYVQFIWIMWHQLNVELLKFNYGRFCGQPSNRIKWQIIYDVWQTQTIIEWIEPTAKVKAREDENWNQIGQTNPGDHQKRKLCTDQNGTTHTLNITSKRTNRICGQWLCQRFSKCMWFLLCRIQTSVS